MTIQVLKDIQEQIQYQQNRLKFYNEQQEFIAPLQALMDEVEGSLSVSTYTVDLTVTGGMGKLYGLIERLGELGYTTGKELPENTETYWFARFEGVNQDVPYPTVYLSYSNNQCHRVKIGTEMKEVDVYEVRCHE